MGSPLSANQIHIRFRSKVPTPTSLGNFYRVILAAAVAATTRILHHETKHFECALWQYARKYPEQTKTIWRSLFVHRLYSRAHLAGASCRGLRPYWSLFAIVFTERGKGQLKDSWEVPTAESNRCGYPCDHYQRQYFRLQPIPTQEHSSWRSSVFHQNTRFAIIIIFFSSLCLSTANRRCTIAHGPRLTEVKCQEMQFVFLINLQWDIMANLWPAGIS